MLFENDNFCVYHTLSEVNCIMFDMMIELVMYLSNHRMMCMHDMMKKLPMFC